MSFAPGVMRVADSVVEKTCSENDVKKAYKKVSLADVYATDW